MDMPNEYYNQGRRRGNQPGGMFYQTPMGDPGMGGSIPTFPNSMPMGGAGVGNNPLHPTPMGVPNINRNPDFGNWPGNMQSPTTIPGGPLKPSPLEAPNFPNGGPGMDGPMPPMYEPSNPMTGGGTGGGPGPYQPPRNMPGDTGGTRIPGGPLKESPLGGGMGGGTAGVAPGEWRREMGGGMNPPNTPGSPGPDGGGRGGGGGQVIDGGWNLRQRRGGGAKPQGMLPPPPPSQRGNNQGGMGAQKSYSSSYNPNTNRNRNTTNRYSTGGNMNANRMRSGYNRNLSGPNSGFGRRQGSASPSSRYNPFFASGRYQPRSGGGGYNSGGYVPRGRGSYDTGGLRSPGSGGYSPGGHYDRYPRSPGMPSITNRNYDNRRISNRNYDQSRTYNTQTFNEGDTSTTQGPRIAKTMERMEGYNPMMHGSQSRQIGGLRNLQRMLAAMRGGRR